jgi:predicted nucleic acid-binding Zn ribbon protein
LARRNNMKTADKHRCTVCGRAFTNGITSKVCSNSCVKVAEVVRKRGCR